MRICGIDPGTRFAGFGVVDDDGGHIVLVEAGVAVAAARMPLPQRLATIRDQLGVVLRRVKPDAVVVERSFFGENPQSLIAMGEGRGIALVCALDSGAALHEYSPAEIKKAVSGSGAATKARVATMVGVLLGRTMDDLVADATDALAAAICHAHRRHLVVTSAAGIVTDLLRGARGARVRRGRGR